MSLLDSKGNVNGESKQFRDIAKVCKDLFNLDAFRVGSWAYLGC